MDLVLASASPARAAVLRGDGVDPVVEVSGVDEDAVMAGLGAEQGGADPHQLVTALAAAKAAAVADRVAGTHPDAVVVGCDSMLLADGELVGKPGTVEVARRRWRRLAGSTGELLTGHTVVRLVGGMPRRSAEGAASTTIRFREPDGTGTGGLSGQQGAAGRRRWVHPGRARRLVHRRRRRRPVQRRRAQPAAHPPAPGRRRGQRGRLVAVSYGSPHRLGRFCRDCIRGGNACQAVSCARC